MPVCGWVVRMTGEPGRWEEARRALARLRGITVGEPQGPRLPVVSEGEDPAEVYAVPERLLSVPGVAHVDLVFSDLSDVHRVPGAALRRGGRRRGPESSAAPREV